MQCKRSFLPSLAANFDYQQGVVRWQTIPWDYLEPTSITTDHCHPHRASISVGKYASQLLLSERKFCAIGFPPGIDISALISNPRRIIDSPSILPSTYNWQIQSWDRRRGRRRLINNYRQHHIPTIMGNNGRHSSAGGWSTNVIDLLLLRPTINEGVMWFVRGHLLQLLLFC